MNTEQQTTQNKQHRCRFNDISVAFCSTYRSGILEFTALAVSFSLSPMDFTLFHSTANSLRKSSSNISKNTKTRKRNDAVSIDLQITLRS
jgi:hypothetical protein